MSGKSDFSSSVYPQINENALAGPAAYFIPKKSQAPFNIFNSVAGRTILNTFSISKHFHPGQHAEQPSNYSERFALDDYPTVPKAFYISKDYHPGQSKEKKSTYSERFALDSEDEDRAPKKQRAPNGQPRRNQPARTKGAERPASEQLISAQAKAAEQPLSKLISAHELEELVEYRVAERLQAALSAATATPIRRTRQHRSSEAKARATEEESEVEGNTIIVEASSDSEDEDEDEDEEPVCVRRTRKRPQAAKDISSDEESTRATRNRRTKRTRSAPESSDEEPLAKRRSFKAAKPGKCSDKESCSSFKSQTKKANVPLRRSHRLR